MSFRPESLYTSACGLSGFIVVISVMQWVSAAGWNTTVTNRNPIMDWRNISLDGYRLAKEYQGVCQDNSDCRENAYICRNGFCNCALGYKLDEKMEICLGGIGSKCMYDSHCIRRAYCKGQTICTCKLEFPVVSSDKWSCGEFGSKAAVVSSSFLSFMLLCFFKLLVKMSCCRV